MRMVSATKQLANALIFLGHLTYAMQDSQSDEFNNAEISAHGPPSGIKSHVQENGNVFYRLNDIEQKLDNLERDIIADYNRQHLLEQGNHPNRPELIMTGIERHVGGDLAKPAKSVAMASERHVGSEPIQGASEGVTDANPLNAALVGALINENFAHEREPLKDTRLNGPGGNRAAVAGKSPPEQTIREKTLSEVNEVSEAIKQIDGGMGARVEAIGKRLSPSAGREEIAVDADHSDEATNDQQQQRSVKLHKKSVAKVGKSESRGESDLCVQACGHCRNMLSLRWAALCTTQCEQNGPIYNACVTLWTNREKLAKFRTRA